MTHSVLTFVNFESPSHPSAKTSAIWLHTQPLDIDAILALRRLAELHREFRKPLHVAYIDIEAAFDSVDRLALWKALHATGAPQFLIQLIQDLHTGTTSRVRSGKRLSKAFGCAAGMCTRPSIILSGNRLDYVQMFQQPLSHTW